MIHPIPNGTRDVLPDEMRELRAITEAMRGVFEHRGYGEVWTPAIEFEDVLRRGETGVDPGYRVFDDHGQVMALRAGHDGPDRARRRHALRDAPSRRCASPTSRTPTAACARTAGRCASSCRPGSSWSARPGRTGPSRR